MQNRLARPQQPWALLSRGFSACGSVETFNFAIHNLVSSKVYTAATSSNTMKDRKNFTRKFTEAIDDGFYGKPQIADIHSLLSLYSKAVDQGQTDTEYASSPHIEPS